MVTKMLIVQKDRKGLYVTAFGKRVPVEAETKTITLYGATYELKHLEVEPKKKPAKRQSKKLLQG